MFMSHKHTSQISFGFGNTYNRMKHLYYVLWSFKFEQKAQKIFEGIQFNSTFEDLGIAKLPNFYFDICCLEE